MQILGDFIKSSNNANNEDELFKLFSQSIRKLGFDVEAYFAINSLHAPVEDRYVAAFATEDVHAKQFVDLVKLYQDKDIVIEDASHELSRITGKNILWDYYPAGFNVSPKYKSFISDVKSIGFTSGITIPIFGVGTEMAYLELGMYHGKIEEQSEALQIAKLMGYHMQERLRHFHRVIKCVPNLSPREKEVLQWVMEGKSDSVIADIMTISDHTVDTYLRRCYKKLDVSNRMSAVVKAINLGIIGG